MKPNDTPRSEDAILVGSNTLNQGEYVRADFARQLERELNAQIEENKSLKTKLWGMKSGIGKLLHPTNT